MSGLVTFTSMLYDGANFIKKYHFTNDRNRDYAGSTEMLFVNIIIQVENTIFLITLYTYNIFRDISFGGNV